jgi:Domain of unknown function (4846)
MDKLVSCIHKISLKNNQFMFSKSGIIILGFLLVACNNSSSNGQNIKTTTIASSKNLENPYTTINKIPLPTGFIRVVEPQNSFGIFLQNIGLKKDKTVYKFNGQLKGNQAAQFAVLDVSVGDKDLQQCADAIMRLRAEYLFAEKRFAEIDFTDNNNKHYKFTEPYNRTHFTTYLQQVFGMCGSASLAKQLNKVNDFSSIKIGDVLIRGGFPGHAVQVMDMATNDKGEKIYLLAQGFMPAQDIHVLVNDNDANLNPWYVVDESTFIKTPEYTFGSNELKQW